MYRIVMLFLIVPAICYSQIKVKTVDILEKAGFKYNGIGPCLVKYDQPRNRIITANTLSSSISIIDGKTDKVRNFPIGSRALQHLKSAALAINQKNGDAALIGTKSLIDIDLQNDKSTKIATDAQLESVAIDDNTGHIFTCGRESKYMYLYSREIGRLIKLDWLDREKKLMNLNQTPPPPIRRVVTIPELNIMAAWDGYESMLYIFNPATGEITSSRKIPLNSGGRWHYAGYNPELRSLFIVTETDKRKVNQAGMIDLAGGNDIVVDLPKGFSEPVGICYHPGLNRVYIPYDNNPSVHSIDFNKNGEIFEIAIPAFGNDASALDINNNYLFIGSWAEGEVEVINLIDNKFVKKITGQKIIPHMFAMCFNSNNGCLYFPVGATAVNGCFGASVTKLNWRTEETKKIYTGWAPIELIPSTQNSADNLIVFNNEDSYAGISPDGSFSFNRLPYDYPLNACYGPDSVIYLSYGPHQSYWPTVYIWAAKNGLLEIDRNGKFYDRRIPAQSLAMAHETNGKLYMATNNWGRREQFLSVIKDGVRKHEIGDRLRTRDTVERETTQRLLKYDPVKNLLYLARVAEKDDEPGILQIIDPDSSKVMKSLKLGFCVTDLYFDKDFIYTANFDSDEIVFFDKENYDRYEVKTGDGPLRILGMNNKMFVLNHLSNSLTVLADKSRVIKIPYPGLPDNFKVWNGKIIITVFNNKQMYIISFDPVSGKFDLIHTTDYPYAETTMDNYNSAFYMRGQFGDAVFALSKLKIDLDNRLWISDFLSGKVYILED